MITVGPEFLPAEDFGIVEQQAPERDEVSIYRPLILRSGAEQLGQQAVSSLRTIRGDAALASFGAAVLAEAGDAFAGPTATDGILERALALAAPRDPVHLGRVTAQVAFYFSGEMGAVFGVIEAGADSAPAWTKVRTRLRTMWWRNPSAVTR